MPLLLCPNDNGSMQTVQRSGVEFDICPTCRGVWLDRGELEKLLAVAGDNDPGDPRAQAQVRPGRDTYDPEPSPRPEGRRERDDDDDDYRRRKRRPSIFDIFD
jgi:Zn-finger nucleic acid-binding protein